MYAVQEVRKIRIWKRNIRMGPYAKSGKIKSPLNPLIQHIAVLCILYIYLYIHMCTYV